MDRVVASFANERGNYLLGLDRLGESLGRQMGSPAEFDFHGFRGEASVGAPPHLENPYAFKIYVADTFWWLTILQSFCFPVVLPGPNQENPKHQLKGF